MQYALVCTCKSQLSDCQYNANKVHYNSLKKQKKTNKQENKKNYNSIPPVTKQYMQVKLFSLWGARYKHFFDYVTCASQHTNNKVLHTSRCIKYLQYIGRKINRILVRGTNDTFSCVSNATTYFSNGTTHSSYATTHFCYTFMYSIKCS